MGMQYHSTRGDGPGIGFDACILQGLAGDGGLYLPQSWPQLPAVDAGAHYSERLIEVLHRFGAGSRGSLSPLVGRALAGFRHPDIAPLRQVADNLYLLELFHGPTAAFKDFAMQVLAQLLEAALARLGQRLLLLTATSGDTGAAAVRAFAGSAQICLITLHPKGKVSPVQRRQMTTCPAPNILNLAVDGDFDACQRMVKTALAQARAQEGWGISSVNSINWGRLAGQIPYFLQAAARLDGPAARFVVPTGNFGDAFSGWAARTCGARTGPIVAAVNRNDSLARTWADGRLQRLPTISTASVSMDVQAPSNLERLVFEAAGRDSAPVRAVFEEFARAGSAQLPPAILANLREAVEVMAVDDAQAAQAMRLAHQRYGEIVCPHTAVGLAAAGARQHDGPTIVLATAHPAKFPEAVAQNLGLAPALPPALEGLAGLPERVQDCRAEVGDVLLTMRQMMAAA